ncbi:MAG TPA: phage GP46 family protein [Rhodopila sp.]|jgi:phage gp46-like protein|nr:phage GP46 family protein [Rhodopila sp.]
MPDIRIVWNAAQGRGDWSVAIDDLDTSDTLQTAALLSLFTDKRAPDSLKIYSTDRRGWWGDTYGDRPLGSLLWTLERAIKSDGVEVLRRAEGYCSDALQWLIDDGVVASISVTASWFSQTNLGVYIAITQPDGTVTKYTWAWSTV